MDRNITYRRLFFMKELRFMLGVRYAHFIRLTALISAMLLSLGLALGGLNSLRKHMDDPFSNTVVVKIPGTYVDYTDEVVNDIMDSSVMAKYNLQGCEFSQKDIEFIYKLGNTWNECRPVHFMMRSLNPQSALTRRILDEDPEILIRKTEHSYGYADPLDQMGFIVTEDMVEKLGLDPQTVSYLPYAHDNDAEFLVMFPVIAVVSKLPDKADMAVLDGLALQMNVQAQGERVLYDVWQSSADFKILFSGADSTAIDGILKKSGLLEKTLRGEYWMQIFPMDKRNALTEVSMYMDDLVDFEARKDMVKELKAMVGGEVKVWLSVGTTASDLTGTGASVKRNSLNFIFDKEGLEGLTEFGILLDSLSGKNLALDLSQIQSSKNFARVANLTYSLGAGMFLFCLLGMVFYMNNMVVNHMERSKSGLGTLSAFGLSIRDLSNIYGGIVISFCLAAYGISLLVVGTIKAVLWIWDLSPVLDLFNPYILIASFVCLSIVMLSVRYAMLGYLRKTPGDLIFKR